MRRFAENLPKVLFLIPYMTTTNTFHVFNQVQQQECRVHCYFVSSDGYSLSTFTTVVL